MMVELPANGPDPALQEHGIEACRNQIEARGGVVERYLTDGFLAAWPERRSAAAAVAGALADVKRLQNTHYPRLGMVVHRGPTEDIHAGEPIESELNGPAIFQVLRMQKLMQQGPDRILVSAAAAEHLRQHLRLQRTRDHEPPGTQVIQSLLTL
jgi:class 3 adenylate cyclase